MEYVKLKGLVDLKQGLAINSKSNHLVVDYETSLPLLRIADMPTKRKEIFMDEKTPERFWASEEDIIYTRTGQVGLVFRGQKGVVHNNCFRVIPLDENILDRNYLYWVLTLKSIYNYANSIAAGAAQPDLPHDSFKTIRIPFDDISVQRKIVAILDNYDKAIENNNKRIKILEQMSENLYKEWFVRFRFPGHENVEFEGGIPKSFEYKKFSEICSFIRGVSYSSDQIDDDSFPDYLINLKNLRDYGGFRKQNYKLYNGECKNEQIVDRFDLVMAITEMVQERRIIGYTGLIPSYNNKCVISADLIKIVSDYGKLFLYSLFTYGGGSMCFSQYGNGTNVIHLKPTSIANVKLLIPPRKLTNEYEGFVGPIFDSIDNLQLQNEKLVAQRELLLPRLMSGKLEVK